MRPQGTGQELEKRRFHALRLLRLGYGPTEVGNILEVTRRTVQRWQARVRTQGTQALRAKPPSDGHPKLDAVQKQGLVRALLQGPKAHGFVTDLWTGRRVAALIRAKYGVSYHPHHIPRLLRSVGWSPQRPELRAYERDPDVFARFLRDNWPRIRKKNPSA